jgi:hypothetical protein
MGLGLVSVTTFSVTALAGASIDKKTHSTCSAYRSGKNGVIRTFCTGTATATVTVGSTTTTMKGGTCAKSGPYFTVNVGVVVGPGFKGIKPLYFGLDIPPKATSFTNGVLSYAVGGTGGYAATNSGTVTSNHKHGTFSGTDMNGAPVRGTFSC